MMKNSGQTLLEALIALGALVTILTAVSVTVLTSLNNSSFVKQQNQANKLSQQGIEYIRDQINSNDKFSTYTLLSGAKCFNQFGEPTVIANTSCNNSSNIGVFMREVTFLSQDCDSGGVAEFTDGLQVKVNVYWTSGKCQTGAPFCHSQEVRSCFINPRKLSPTTQQGI